MEWMKDLTTEDFPEQYHEIIDLIGMENTVKLALLFKSQAFYFGHIKVMIEKKKKEYVRKKFNGSNHKELARATDYSERWVYEILKDKKDDRQVELF